MELDDVIDAMIAERVIHRHRRKWIVLFAVLLVLILVILVTGGFKKREDRSVPEFQAPVQIDAGRFQFEFEDATVVHKPASGSIDAETRVDVEVAIRNVDEESKKSDSVNDNLLRLVLPGRKLITSKGATCRGELNYRLVYGLPAVQCVATFEVPVDFTADQIEVGVIGEKYESVGDLGDGGQEFWQEDSAIAVVQMPAKKKTETKTK